MALKVPYEITCACGETFTDDLFEYVFTEYDPEVKDILIQGGFNRVECPACHKQFYGENRFIYRDEANKLWVWVCKRSDQMIDSEEERLAIEEARFIENHSLTDVSLYKKYTVYGIEELLFLLHVQDPEMAALDAPTPPV